MKKKKSLMTILGLLLVIGMAAGVHIYSAQAAPGKTRGRENLDLAKMQLRDSSTTSDKSGLVKNDDGSSYTLHYKNKLGDMNNIGIEYYYSEQLEMTDVTRIEMSGERTLACDCKIYLYLSDSTSTNKCRVDDKDMETSTFSAYGGDYFRQSTFGLNQYNIKGFDVSPRYGKLYLHMGLVHDWGVHDAELKIGNVAGNCVNLVLKEHKAGVLDVENVDVVDKDGNVKQVKLLSNLKLSLNDGTSHSPGSTGSVYRDEQMTIQYTRNGDYDFDIVGYKFYSDAEKKNLLYTYEIPSGENQTTITLTSSLIQTLEKSLGTRNLGNFYIEPLLEQKDVTFDFQTKAAVVEDVSVTTEKEKVVIKDTVLNQVIGEIKINTAKHLGDYFSMKYVKNDAYTGDYEYRYAEVRTCESSANVSFAQAVTVKPSGKESVADYNEKLKEQYFWLSVHVALEASLDLQDKTVTYDNQYHTIDPASVTYPEGKQSPKHMNEITYTYYTDAECTEKMAENEKPINAGIYYVKATMASDDLYKAAESNVAKLTIEKAVPEIVSADAGEITYGQKLGEGSAITGTVKGVSGSDITNAGEFVWEEDGNVILDVGTHSRNVKFVLTNESMKANYTDALGKAFVTVGLQTPDVDMKDAVVEYTGEPLVVEDTAVTDIYTGNPTGQTIYYYYFGDVNGDGEIGTEEYLTDYQAPTEAGVYEVEAEVYAEGGNYGTNKDRATIEITKRKVDSFILLKEEQKEIHVVLTNTVDVSPQGMVQIRIGETVIGEASLEKSGQGYYFASFDYDTIMERAGDVESFEMVSEYIEEADESYTGEASKWVIYKNVDHGTVEKELIIEYNETKKVVPGEDFLNEIEGDIPIIEWQTTEDEIVSLEQNGNELTIQAKQAGSTVLTGQVIVNGIMYDIVYRIQVKKAEPQIVLDDMKVTYSARTACSEPAKVVFDNVDYSGKINVSYEYFKDAACTEKAEPVDAGTYYVKASISEGAQWGAASKVAELVIEKAVPEVILEDKLMLNPENKDKKIIDPPTVRGVSIAAENGNSYEEVGGEITYEYVCMDSNATLTSDGLPSTKGEYKAIATVAETKNYTSASDEATLYIVFRPVAVVTRCASSAYGEEDVQEGEITVLADTGKDIYEQWKDYVTIRYASVLGGEILEERPVEAGSYYAWAVLTDPETGHKKQSKTIEFVIHKSDVTVQIPDVIKKQYDGKAVEASGAVVKGVNDGKEITDDVVLSYHYYSDAEGTIEIPAPVEAGEYYVRAVTEETKNYNGGVSELQKIIITKEDEELFEGSFTSDEDDAKTDNEDKTDKESEAAKTGVEDGFFQYLIIAILSFGIILFSRKWQGGIRNEE